MMAPDAFSMLKSQVFQHVPSRVERVLHMSSRSSLSLSRRRFLRQTSLVTAASTILPRGLHAQTGAHAGAPDAYAKPKPDLYGSFKPTWASIRDLHRTPAWFNQAKFGIFIHWGLYSIPARINEWYIKHMYTSDVEWHTQHYGAPDKFGYKDFIPLFTVPNYHCRFSFTCRTILLIAEDLRYS
jgi:hypothetical protein